MKKLIFIGFLILAVSLWTAPAKAAQSLQVPLAGLVPNFATADPLPMLHTIPDWSFNTATTTFRGAYSMFSAVTVPATGDVIYLKAADGANQPGYYKYNGTWNPVLPIELRMEEFQSKILPAAFYAALPAPYNLGTYVWGYRTNTTPADSSYIGPVIVAKRYHPGDPDGANGAPTAIRYTNNLGVVDFRFPDGNASNIGTKVLAWKYSTDQTLHWADPLGISPTPVIEENRCAMKVSENGFVGPLGNQTYPPPDDPCAWNYGEQQAAATTPTTAPIPAVVHLHGGEVPPELDGGPDAWFTSNGIQGHGYYSAVGAAANEAIYKYPNTQEAANIWFHDHVLGMTRLNVYAGMAGAYVLVDPPNSPPNTELAGLTGAAKIIPLVIQDRMFDTNGQLFFPADTANNILWTTNPEHPYWVPEFVGDVIVVNGKAWPFLNVEPGLYRFLFLNGSNARTYELFLPTPLGILPLWVIGTDGGYLDKPVPVNKLVIMPGERYDVIIDFTGLTPGTSLIMKNTGRTPYPKGAPPNGTTVGQIMEFRIQTPAGDPKKITTFNTAQSLRPTLIKRLFAAGGLPANPVYRQLTLNEVMGMPIAAIDPVTNITMPYPGGPLEVVLNNTKLSGERVDIVGGGPKLGPIPYYTAVAGLGSKGTIYYSELPQEGVNEVWEIVNITADAHPVHLHLVQFQIISRQNFNVNTYTAAYNAAFKGGGWDPLTNMAYLPGVFIPGYGPPLPYDPFYQTTNEKALTGGKFGGNPDVYAVNAKNKSLYLQGKSSPPAAEENGWKDTVISYPGQVLRLAVRWAPTDLAAGTTPANAYFPFGPNGHGYVWHCHIIDHEDNEMMRPTQVQPLVIASGTATGGNGTTLIDSTAPFTAALVGSRVNNTTDDSTGVITAFVSPTTLTIGAGMSGGNTFAAGEGYRIVPNRTFVKGAHY